MTQLLSEHLMVHSQHLGQHGTEIFFYSLVGFFDHLYPSSNGKKCVGWDSALPHIARRVE